MVEHPTFNRMVGSSILPPPTNKINHLDHFLCADVFLRFCAVLLFLSDFRCLLRSFCASLLSASSDAYSRYRLAIWPYHGQAFTASKQPSGNQPVRPRDQEQDGPLTSGSHFEIGTPTLVKRSPPDKVAAIFILSSTCTRNGPPELAGCESQSVNHKPVS